MDEQGRVWPRMVDYVRMWPTLVEYSRSWLITAEFGSALPGMAEYSY
jgi:hypothetical protein